MERIPFDHKLSDTVTIAPDGRLEQYWRGEIIKNVFKSSRASAEAKGKFKFHDPHWLMEHFGLRGFEFGNWLNQKDRYIFLAGAAYAVKDYCKLLKVRDKDFGLGNRVSIALGARGQGGAAIAHFEPKTFAINITKYNNGGSLGHEYGHALDFYAGRYVDSNGNFNFLSEKMNSYFAYSHMENGKMYFKLNAVKTDLEKLYILSFGEILYTKVKGSNFYTESEFYSKLKYFVQTKATYGEYYTRIIEIFARTYEVFLFKKCAANNIEESFLKKKKYNSDLYPSEKLFTASVMKNFTLLSQIIIKKASNAPV